MTKFTQQITVGEDGSAVTYHLADGHYLLRIREGAVFSAVSTFAASGLLKADIPQYIEAARRTLERAGFRWVELIPGFNSADAEAHFEAIDAVEEVLPVYFEAGLGPESAATPIFDTVNVQISGDERKVIKRLEKLGLIYQPAMSELLAPLHVFNVTPQDGRSVTDRAFDLMEQILATDGVDAAEFDWLKFETFMAVPNDTLFAQQWDMTTIGLPAALDIAAGSPNIWIAAIDSGFDLGHPDINFTTNAGPNPTHFNADQFIAGAPPPYDASSAGVSHGTAVAGIAGAQLNNALGVAGVGGGCSVMPVRLGTVPSANRVAAGVNWAANNGARVASMSLGTSATVAATNAMNNAWTAGLVICAATGNSGGNTTSPAVNFPANHPNVIAVGASDRNDQRKRPASADNETWGSQFDARTDVVAPGVQIWTTDEQGANGYNNNNGGPTTAGGVAYPSSGDAAGDYYSVFNGTSAATPHVAGLAGLIISANNGLTNQQVRDIIESTCAKVNPIMYPYAVTPGRTNGTWHQEMGYGRINVQAAVSAAAPPITPITVITTISPITPITAITPITTISPITSITPVTTISPITPITGITPLTAITPVTVISPVTTVTPITPVTVVTPVTTVSPISPLTGITPITTISPVTAITTISPIMPGTPITLIEPITPIDPIDPIRPVDPVDTE